MYRLPEKKLRRSATWRQLMPRCSHTECTTGSSWTGMLHRMSGFRVNENQWFCSARCLEESLEERLLDCFFDSRHPSPVRTVMPMGLMLLSRGIINNDQLNRAVEMQRSGGEPIGSCLRRITPVTHEELASVVATQWGCPVFPAESVQPGCSMLLPLSLIERYRMVAVHLVSQGRRLFVGFCDRVDHSVLICIEQMLGCETEACIIPEPRFEQVLEYRKHDTEGELAVLRPRSAMETARMIRNYAQQSGADALRLCTVDGNIWARLLCGRSHLDLVFEQPAR